MQKLFHAYVVGGDRKDARNHIEKMLLPLGLMRAGTPDYIVSEHVSFSIDNARTLRAWQELLPESGNHKVSVIYTDFVTKEAENALLKTFEEPTPGTHIFFAVPNPHILLPTLLSRMQVIMPEKTSSENFSGEGKKFLASSRAERLAFVSKLVEKSEDEEAAAEVRERTLGFINQLEAELAQDAEKNKIALAALLKFKKYIYISGSSARILLETLALTI